MKITVEHSGRKFDVDLPDSWDDVTHKNWIHILQFRSCFGVADKPVDQWQNPLEPERHLILNNYLQARAILMSIDKRLKQYITVELVWAIADEMTWLADLPNHYRSMTPTLYWIWRGPKNQLIDWNWGRYAMTEEKFKKYIDSLESTDIKTRAKAVNELFACMYALFGFWNFKVADFYFVLARIISTRKKELAIANYSGLRNWIQDVYSEAFNGGSSSDTSGASIRELTIAMSGDKFGTVDKVVKQNFHMVLQYQCMLHKEIQRSQSNKGGVLS